MEPSQSRLAKILCIISWIVYLIFAWFAFIISLLSFNTGFSSEVIFFVIAINGIPLITMILMSFWAIRTGNWVRSILSLPMAVFFYFVPGFVYDIVKSKPLLRLENFTEERRRDIEGVKFNIEKATEDRSKCIPIENSGNYQCPY
jgi:hypothetical protein